MQEILIFSHTLLHYCSYDLACLCNLLSPSSFISWMLLAAHFEVLHIPRAALGSPCYCHIETTSPQRSLCMPQQYLTHRQICAETHKKILLDISVLAIAERKHKIKIKYKHQELVASFSFESVQHWDGHKLLLHSCQKGKHQAIAGNIYSIYIHTHSYVHKYMSTHLRETCIYTVMELRYIYIYSKSIKAFCSEQMSMHPSDLPFNFTNKGNEPHLTLILWAKYFFLLLIKVIPDLY